ALIGDPVKKQSRFKGVMKIGKDYYDLSSPLGPENGTVTLDVDTPSDDELSQLAAQCGASLATSTGTSSDAISATAPPTAQANGPLMVAEVATEADNEYVIKLGSAANANADILAVLNGVDGIYQAQLNVTLSVTFQHAWEVTPEPYSSTDPNTAL